MTDVMTQYNAVRNGIGFIDRSEAGKIAIWGEDRFAWLQGMISNDTRLLTDKQFYGFFQACILDATGHVLTDMSLVRGYSEVADEVAEVIAVQKTVFVFADQVVFADLPRENVSKIVTLLERFIVLEDVGLKDVSATVGCFALQGPLTEGINKIYRRSGVHPFDKVLSRTYLSPAGYTGEHGYNAYFLISDREPLRQDMLQNDWVEIETEAQEMLRVEAGIPKYGVDMDETTLAPEAGLMATHISLTKGCYVGQEIIARIHSRGHTNRALTGLVFADGDVPASGNKIVVEEDGGIRETGRITSVVASSPVVNGRPIALGYVRHEHRAPGNRLQIVGDDRTRMAEVVELPFYRRLA